MIVPARERTESHLREGYVVAASASEAMARRVARTAVAVAENGSARDASG